MSSSSNKSRGAESLRLLTKVIEARARAKGRGRKGSKLSHLVTLGLALVLLQTEVRSLRFGNVRHVQEGDRRVGSVSQLCEVLQAGVEVLLVASSGLSPRT